MYMTTGNAQPTWPARERSVGQEPSEYQMRAHCGPTCPRAGGLLTRRTDWDQPPLLVGATQIVILLDERTIVANAASYVESPAALPVHNGVEAAGDGD